MIKYRALVFFSIFTAFSAQACNTEFGISYEQYRMPNHLPALGVLGIHALKYFSSHFYGGLVGFEGVSGNKGGYFGLGLDGGAQYPVWKSLSADAGVRVGGAGGRDSPVGGGLFVEPYVGLKYPFSFFTAGLEYSYIDFPSGQISSDQIGVGISFPLRDEEKIYTGKNYIALLARESIPSADTKDTAGNKDTAEFQSVGVELGHFLSRDFFAYGNFVGAFHGRLNGYAQSILGLGYQYPLSEKFSVIGKIGAGSAGGGGVNTGGGFIVEPNFGVEYDFVKSLGVELNGGYVDAPYGKFQASEINFLLKYYFRQENASTEFLKKWRMRILNQTYLSPKNNAGGYNPTMQLLNVDFDYFIKKYFYATGQTAFAYSGRNTGGYFSGLLGAGLQSRNFSSNVPVSVFAELLGGTAGGAGLDISSGALVEPNAGINYAINKNFGLQLSAGQLIAVRGHFNSTVVSAGITIM